MYICCKRNTSSATCRLFVINQTSLHAVSGQLHTIIIVRLHLIDLFGAPRNAKQTLLSKCLIFFSNGVSFFFFSSFVSFYLFIYLLFLH